MKKSGFIILIVSIVIVISSVALIYNNQEITKLEPNIDHESEEKGDISKEAKEVIFNKEGVVLTFYWLEGQPYLSNEESEIIVLTKNQGTTIINYPTMSYSTLGKKYSSQSASWEAYPTETSWEYIDRKNIGRGHSGEDLVLEKGQKGKIHFHFLFDDEFAKSKNQGVNITMNIKIGKTRYSINKELQRIVEPKSNYKSNAEHPVGDYLKSKSHGY